MAVERRIFIGPPSRYGLALFLILFLLSPMLGIPAWPLQIVAGITAILLIAGQ